MQNNRSAPSAAPEAPKRSGQALLKETDLRRCIELLQFIICDLLIENERLQQYLVADKFLSFDTGHLRGKHGDLCKPKTEDFSCCKQGDALIELNRAPRAFRPVGRPLRRNSSLR